MKILALVALGFATVAVMFGFTWLIDRLAGGPARRARSERLMAECEAIDARERLLDARPKAPIVHAPEGAPGENDWLAAIELDYDFLEHADYQDGRGQTRPHPGSWIVRIPNGDDLGSSHFVRTADRFGTGRKTFNDLHRLIAEVRRLRPLAHLERGAIARCDHCPHPPHIGQCLRRSGDTAYQCGCLHDAASTASAAGQGDQKP